MLYVCICVMKNKKEICIRFKMYKNLNEKFWKNKNRGREKKKNVREFEKVLM